MNPEQLKTQLADGLLLAVRKGWPSTHVCYWHDKFRVMPAMHTPERHPVFRTFGHTYLSGGLTSSDWSNLVKPILLYIQELKSCQPHRKHSPGPNATFF